MPHEIELPRLGRTPPVNEPPGAARFSGCEGGVPFLKCLWRVGLQAATIGLLLSAVLARHASAYDANDPANCNGAEWDAKLALTVSRVTAQPRVNFIKSPYDDDFAAVACPAATKACQKKSYLVAGDLVLVGRTRGDFTCVSYQSPLARNYVSVNGWLPSAALTPVAPLPSPKTSDWIGTWCYPGCSIEIKASDGGKLQIEAFRILPPPRDFHNGSFKANVAPRDNAIAFADEGGYGDECRVRMQRVGPWLLVVDNSGCGGAGSFTGLYRRKK
jgi:hypothetical protein